jgi:hypothetical protein
MWIHFLVSFVISGAAASPGDKVFVGEKPRHIDANSRDYGNR